MDKEESVEDPDDFQSAFTDAIEEGEASAAPEEVAPESEAPAPEPVAPAEPVAPSALDSLLENAREVGLSVDGIDSEEALAKTVLEQLKSQQPYVSYAQQIAPYADEISQYISGRGKQQPEPEPKQPEAENEWDTASYLKEKYGGPDWKPEFDRAISLGLVDRDDSGQWVPAAGKELLAQSVVQDMNMAQAHRAQFWQDLANKNPYEVFHNVLQEPFMRAVEEKVKSILSSKESETQKETVISKFEADNASWLYAKDPQTGNRINTKEGQAFIDTVNELRSEGVENPATLLRLASQLHGLGNKPTEVPAAETSEPEPKKNFLESAKQRASHNPSARERGGDSTPQAMTEGDLDSLFVRAHREMSHN